MKKHLLFLALIFITISSALAQSKIPITVKPTASTVEFTGNLYTLSTDVHDIHLTSGSLRVGDAIASVTMDSAYFVAGTYDVKVKTIRILDDHGVDVTDSIYDITMQTEVLTINHREEKYNIYPQTRSANPQYDGTLQEIDGFVQTSFEVNGHYFNLSGMTAHVEGTNVGTYNDSCYGTPVVTLDTMGLHLDVTEEFVVTPVLGTLVISPKELSIYVDTTKNYDGTIFSVDYTQVAADLVTGDALIAGEIRSSSANTGVYSLNNSSCAVTTPFQTANGIDNYVVIYAVTQTIKPLPVVDTVKGSTYTGDYDATTHSVSGYTHNISNAMYSESDITGPNPSSVTASRMVAGKTAMNLRPAQFGNKNDNFDVTFVIQDGFVEIEKIGPITITTHGGEKIYDGVALENDTFSYSGTILAGDELSAVLTGSQLNAGTSNNTLDSYQIMHGSVDVTDCYNFTAPVLGKLKIKPVNIYITTVDSTKMYDGTPLRAPRYTITSGTFVGSDKLILDFSDTYITDVGQTVNDYIPVFASGTLPENYLLHNTYGNLKVTDSLRVSCMLFAVACHGGTTSANVYPQMGHEGIAPYQYQVNDGPWESLTGSNAYVSGLRGGVQYTIRMKDALGVVDSIRYTPFDPPALVIDTIITSPANCMASNGKASAVISGGTPVDGTYYFYHWSTGAETPAISNLSDGIYSLTVNDFYGCSATKEFEVEVGKTIDVHDFESIKTCDTTGSYCVTPKNGTNGYIPAGTKFKWGAPIITPASAAPYVTGTTTDSNQTQICTGNIVNKSGSQIRVRYVVTPYNSTCPPGHTFNVDLYLGGHDLLAESLGIAPQKLVTCGNVGSVIDTCLTVKLSGLNLGDTYPVVWHFGDGKDSVRTAHRNDTVATLNVSMPDTCYARFSYRFYITDFYGCTHYRDANYSVDPGSWSVSADLELVTVACAEDAEAPHLLGTLPYVETSCGTPVSYTYSSYATGSTCDMFINHMYTYKDCQDSSATLTFRYHVKDTVAPTTRDDFPKVVKAPVYRCEFSVPSLIDSIKPLSENCNSGFIYYDQDPEPGTIITEDTEVVLTVYDRCGNKHYDTIKVVLDEPVVFSATAYNSQCYDMSDGYIEGEVSGGVPPYDVMWTSETENGAMPIDAPGTFRFDDLADGLYTLTVLSANGCKSEDTVKVTLQDYDEPLTITALSGTRQYDGTVFEKKDYDMDGTLRGDDEIHVTVEGSITNVGSVRNKVTSVVILRDSIDVTCEYNLTTVDGQLTITKRKIKLRSASASKPYDGTPLTAPQVSIVADNVNYFQFPEGEGIDTFQVLGTITFFGHEENDYNYILSSTTNPSNYEIVKEYGLLEIKKTTNTIIVKPNSATKVYDCLPLTDTTYTYDKSALFGKDSLIVTTSGSQTLVGTGFNKIATYKIMRGDTDVTQSYNINAIQIGRLQVTPRQVTLTAGSKSGIVYDGVEHTWQEIPVSERYIVGGDLLATCDHFDTVPLTGGGTLVGNHPTYINLAKVEVKDGSGNVRTNNYEFTIFNGQISIDDHIPPYPITIIAHSDTMDYTGAPLTCSGYDTVIVNGVTYPWNGSSDLHFKLVNENGDTVKYRVAGITASVTRKDAGNYKVPITGTPIIYDDGNHNVTAQFLVDTIPGRFVIRKLGAITIHIKDTKLYDSHELTTAWNHANTWAEGLGSSDALSAGTMVTNLPALGNYSYDDGTPSVPGYSHVGLAFNTTGGIDNYSGVIYDVDQSITTGNIMTLTCPTAANVITKTYDGTELRPNATVVAPVHDGTPATITYSYYDGSAWTAYSNVIPYITHVSESPLNVRVKAEHPYYTTQNCEYTLTINKRPVRFTTPTAEKEYDRTDLTSKTVTIGKSGFATATSEGVDSIAAIGHVRNVAEGTVKNPLYYSLKSNTDPNDYLFDTIIGTLKIKPRPVTIKSGDSTRNYIPAQALKKEYAKVISAKGFLGGDTVTYVFTGSQTIPGFSSNSFVIQNFTAGASDPTSKVSNYAISREYGRLQVNESMRIVMSSQHDTIMYDGKEHIGRYFIVTLNDSVLPVVPGSNGLKFYVYGNDNILTIHPTGRRTIVGETPSTFTYDVHYESLDITTCYPTYTILDTGVIVIIPRPLIIVVNQKKKYDASPIITEYSSFHTSTQGVPPDVRGLVNGDNLSAGQMTTGDIIVGVYNYSDTPSETTASVTIPYETTFGISNYLVSYIVNDTIIPTEHRTIVCPTVAASKKMYDGNILKPNAWVTGQYNSDEFKIEYSTNGTTWSTDTPSIYHVKDSIPEIQVRATHHDYDTATCSYSLYITPRPVKLISGSDEKVYDKTPLTKHTVTVSNESGFYPWVNKDTASYTYTGTQTDVGESKNGFDYSFVGFGYADDYKVTLDSGLLKVTPSPNLQVECPTDPDTLTKQYNGIALQPSADTSGLYTGDFATIEYSADNGLTWTDTVPSITHHRQSPLNIQVRATHPNYVTSTCSYTLTINKRPIEITSADSTQVYDGTENRKEVTSVTNGSFVTGESFVYSAWTGRTHFGTQDNSFNYGPGSGTDTMDYAVTRVYGTLEITPSPLAEVYCPGTTNNTQAITKMYDGTILAPTATAKGIGSDVVPVQYATSASGPWQNDAIGITNVDTLQVFVRTNNADYEVKNCDYTLSITCRHLSLTSQDSIREYDAQPLNAHRITVGKDGFVTGEKFNYSNYASLTIVDTIDNTFNYAPATGTLLKNYCIDTIIYGKLGIYKSDDINLTCPSGAALTKKYDGDELHPSATASGYGSDVIKVEYSFDGNTGWSTTPLGITNVDTQRVYVRASHQYYDTAYCDYELEVTKRNVTLTSATGSREYNGLPYTYDSVSVSGDKFAKTEGFTRNVTGSQTQVGSSKNNFTYTLNAGTLAKNYVITLDTGLLTVYKSDDLVLHCPGTTTNTQPVTKMYDKVALAPTANVTGKFGTDTIKIEYSLDGTSGWTETAPSILHVDTQDVYVRASNPNYDTVTCDYTLEITCRQLLLTSQDSTRTYNAQALVGQRITIGGDKMATGEGISFSNHASITNVGKIKNSFTYTFADTVKAIDYCVTIDTGDLEVTKADITLECPENDDTVKTYDGIALQPAATASGVGSDVIKIEYSINNGTTWSESVPSITHFVESPQAVKVRATNSNYNTANCDYTLAIEKRPIEITSADSTQVYNATENRKEVTTVTSGSFVTGESFVYSAWTGRTHLGSQDNSFNYAAGTGTDTNDYQITKVYGTLEITPSPLAEVYCPGTTENSQSIRKMYDGTILAPTATSKGVGTDVVPVQYATSASGPWQNDSIGITNVDTLQVFVRTNNPDYQVQTCNYTLVVDCRHLSLTSQDSTREYNGEALNAHRVTVGKDGFATGESFTYNSFASRTNVGTEDNTFSYAPATGTLLNNYCVDTVIYGKLDIYKSDDIDLDCPTASDTVKTYDGTALQPAATATGFGSDVIKIEYSSNNGATWSETVPSITHFVESPLKVMVRATNSNYDTATCNYTLAIEKRPIEITSADSTQIYNGTENRKEVTTVTSGSFVTGESFVYSAWTGRTHLGSQDNSFNYAAGTGTDTNDYQITKVYGTLEITPSPLAEVYCPGTTENSQSIRKMYDGTILAPTATSKGIGTDTIPVQYALSASGPWQNDSIGITNVDTLQVFVRTNNPDYQVQTCNYTLVVDCRHLSLTSQDSTREYNGEALNAHRVTVGKDGFATGESFTYNSFASRTNVGTEDNTFSYAPATGTLLNNYCVDTVIYGKLDIYKSDDIDLDCPTASDTVKTYDGTALQPAATATGFGSDVIKIEYSSNNGTTWSETVPSITHFVESPLKVMVRATNSNYDTATCNYTLAIEKRPIEITSADSTQEYDGTENRKEVTTITDGSFVTGESFVYSDWTGRIHFGTQDNSFNYAAGTGTDTNDYQITKVYGKLEITLSQAAVVHCPGTTENTQAVTKMYDGIALAPTAIASGIGTDTIRVQYATSATGPWQNDSISITNVGTQKVYVRTQHPDYEDQTCEYTLEVTCRHLTITSQDSTREYDTHALNAHRITIGKDGFATGESLTYDNFASITNVGTVDNTFNYAPATGTLLSNYCIDTVIYGKLNIYKSDDIVLTCPTDLADLKKMYDGTEIHPAAEANGLGTDTIKIEYSFNGTSDWSTTPLGITNADTQRVYVRATHPNYETETCDYLLEVTKRNILLTSATGSREYNGQPYTNDTVTLTGDGFVTGEGYTTNVTGSQTKVGSSDNYFSYALNAGTLAQNYTITLDTGLLTVYKSNDLVVHCPGTIENTQDIIKMYDGYVLQPTAISAGSFGNDTIKIEYSLNGTSGWTEEVPFILHVDTQDVYVRASNPNYDTAYCDYTLEITCRTITLTSQDSTRVYDATPLVAKRITIGGEGMAREEKLIFSNHATIQDVGTAKNTFDYVFADTARANDYCVTVDTGDLEITKADITLACPAIDSTKKLYDGLEMSPTAIAQGFGTDTIKVEYSIDGGVNWSEVEPSIANVDSLPVMVRASHKNYNTNNCDYALIITPITDTVNVYIKGHTGTFNFDYLEHVVYGYDTTCDNTLYTAVIDTSYSFTGPDSVARTDIGYQAMGLDSLQFSNHNKNFKTVIFHVQDGWIYINDVIKPYFTFGCDDIIAPLTVFPNDGADYIHHGTDWDLQATDDFEFDSLYYSLRGATKVHKTPITDYQSLNGQRFKLGVTEVTWTAKDKAGNDTTCSYIVTVEDNIIPEVTCPGDTTVLCSDIPAAAEDFAEFLSMGGDASDVGSGLDTTTFYLKSATFDGIDCKDTLRRIYAIKDKVGNEGVCMQKLIIIDTIKPDFTVPADTLLCRNSETGVIEADPDRAGAMSDMTDNCSVADEMTIEWADVDTTGTDSTLRVIHRVWTLTDKCDNSISKDQYITIKPSILTDGNVEIFCPNDTLIVLDYGDCDTAILLPLPKFEVHMTGNSVTLSKDYPDDYRYAAETTTKVTWSFTDECGATQYCYQNVTIHYPPCGTPGDSVADYDGIMYSSVRIGCQCWTGENLRSTHYTDGTPIANYRNYNDDLSNDPKYGKLYSWYSAARVAENDNNAVPADSVGPHGTYVQGICPDGWALPTDEDYMIMFATAEYDMNKVKEANSPYWLPGMSGTLPNTGFDARGAGYFAGSRFYNLLGETFFWTSDEAVFSTTANSATINYHCSDGLFQQVEKGRGHSVRCLRQK